FTERALQLWPRVDDPETVAGLDHVRLLTMAARAHQIMDERSRSVVLINEALRELDPDVDPARYAGLLVQQARITWALNRGEEALAIAERAEAMLTEDDPGGERPLLMAWLSRTRFLRGRFRHAASEGEAALKVAVEAGDRLAETEVLNTLGMAYVSLGEVDRGVASLERAIDLARSRNDFDSLATAYSNLADMHDLVGATRAALETAKEGLAATPSHHVRSHAWILLTVAGAAYAAGDWQLAQKSLSPNPSRHSGLMFVFRQLIGA